MVACASRAWNSALVSAVASSSPCKVEKCRNSGRSSFRSWTAGRAHAFHSAVTCPSRTATERQETLRVKNPLAKETFRAKSPFAIETTGSAKQHRTRPREQKKQSTDPRDRLLEGREVLAQHRPLAPADRRLHLLHRRVACFPLFSFFLFPSFFSAA